MDIAKSLIAGMEQCSATQFYGRDPRERWLSQWRTARIGKKGGFYSFLHASATRMLDVRDAMEIGKPYSDHHLRMMERVNKTFHLRYVPARIVRVGVCTWDPAEVAAVPFGGKRLELFRVEGL